MNARGKYFNLQFNRDRTGEAEFEEKLRKMAKDNNLTLTDTVMMLVMAVDHFKISYNVNVDLTEVQREPAQDKKLTMGSALSSDVKSAPVETQQEVQHSILDALKDKR